MGARELDTEHLSGNEATVRALIESGTNLEARNNEGETALIQAAFDVALFGRDPKVLQVLIEAGADVTAEDSEGFAATDYLGFDLELNGAQ